jgi:F420 biosynthesis protein FbiB-like protein
METIIQILETAAFAPNAHNAQPWQFIVLTDNKQKVALANVMAQVWLKDLEEDQIPKKIRSANAARSIERFTAAPALLVACLTLKDMNFYPDVERRQTERDLAVQSLAAAIQTLLLAAHASGLGACWYCAPIFCKPAVREALRIPNNVEPQALITLGYPGEEPQTPPRNAVSHYLHVGKWGEPSLS